MTPAANSNSAQQRRKKLCFVTVGATADFNELIEAVAAPEILNKLSKLGYTDLRLQCGKEGCAVVDAALKQAEQKQSATHGLTIERYDFRRDGLGEEMQSVVARANDYEVVGCVVSHAGSGTILDALRVNAPLIVVPNPSLLENHQEELAEELARQEYVVNCSLKTSRGAGSGHTLADSLDRAESLKTSQKSWPPVNSGESKRDKSLNSIINDELGFGQLD